MGDTARIGELSRAVITRAEAAGVMITAAESCTGGLIAVALTDIAGSSAVVERGFVTYSNEAKIEMLGVSATLIQQHGAVSGEVARAMAAGALARSSADIAVSVTGVAGPTGGTLEKPVGLVWFGLARKGVAARAERRLFAPVSRRFIRLKTVETALMLLLAGLPA
ncbi:MAG: CinA family protein [Parvularculaceae bacterium]